MVSTLLILGIKNLDTIGLQIAGTGLFKFMGEGMASGLAVPDF